MKISKLSNKVCLIFVKFMMLLIKPKCTVCHDLLHTHLEFHYGICHDCRHSFDKKYQEYYNYLFGYDDVKQLILSLKIQKKKRMLYLLCHYLLRFFRKVDGKIVLIPTPSSPKSKKERMFCHITLLCKILSKQDNRFLCLDILSKKNSVEQKKLSYQDRVTKIQGKIKINRFKFALKSKIIKSISDSSKIYLIDDVITSGGTALSCKSALNEVGIDVTILSISKS